MYSNFAFWNFLQFSFSEYFLPLVGWIRGRGTCCKDTGNSRLYSPPQTQTEAYPRSSKKYLEWKKRKYHSNTALTVSQIPFLSTVNFTHFRPAIPSLWSSSTAVPNLLGIRDWFCGRHFFHRPGQGDGSSDEDWRGMAAEASLARPPLTSYCVAQFLTGHGW